MNNEDEYLLEHAERWLPFGGPDEEETMVAFGITRSAYLSRVRELSRRHHDVVSVNVRAAVASLRRQENRADRGPIRPVHRQ